MKTSYKIELAEKIAENEMDMELVRRFKSGDESAFTEIFRKYNGRLFRQVKKILFLRCDAEDAVQQTFISAHRNLHNFRGDCPLYFWLSRIARGRATNIYLYDKRRQRVHHDSIDDEGHELILMENVMLQESTPADECEINEINQALDVCLRGLSHDQRSIILMRASGMSYEQISLTLRIDIGTVKSRLSRARRVLSLEFHLMAV